MVRNPDPKTPIEDQVSAIENIQDNLGIDFLRWLYRQCMGGQTSLVKRSDEQFDLARTAYNEGRRDLYLEIRKHLTAKAAIQVEIGDI